MNVRLKKHASWRVFERLKLSEEEVLEILRLDNCVLINFEKGTNKGHKLFFSAPDQSWFVAVVNLVTGEVITILPFRRIYNKNLIPEMMIAHRLIYDYEKGHYPLSIIDLIFPPKSLLPRYKVFIRTQEANDELIEREVLEIIGELDVSDEYYLSRRGVIARIKKAIKESLESFDTFRDAYITRGQDKFPIVVE